MTLPYLLAFGDKRHANIWCAAKPHRSIFKCQGGYFLARWLISEQLDQWDGPLPVERLPDDEGSLTLLVMALGRNSLLLERVQTSPFVSFECDFQCDLVNFLYISESNVYL